MVEKISRYGMILALCVLFLCCGAVAETAGEKMALEEAKTILAAMPLSFKGLTDQLCLGGYTGDEAEYAATQCGVDWNQQAVRALKRYRDVSGMPEEEIRRQMMDDGFTEEQIRQAFGCTNPMEGEADRLARQYLNLQPYSADGLVDQLRRDGISEEEARRAVGRLGVNWTDEADRAAQRHEREGMAPDDKMQDALKREGFTPEQARDAVNRRHR